MILIRENDDLYVYTRELARDRFLENYIINYADFNLWLYFRHFGVVLNRTCPCLINICRPTLKRSNDKREWMNEWKRQKGENWAIVRKKREKEGWIYEYVREREKERERRATNRWEGCKCFNKFTYFYEN